MAGGYCMVCKKICKWDRHRNAQYIIVTEKQVQLVDSEGVLKTWNKANNSHEGALIGATDKYLSLQEELRTEIINLVELSEELTKTALLHDLSGLINYLETLYKAAKAQGASSGHLAQLATAINSLILVRELSSRLPILQTKTTNISCAKSCMVE
ncbi:hypothetical protein F4804DRAFT_218712 [Jackrogersella minutella]|nr:hypothetical protein F4804DRAFT_218712 [Jackrogersella minutella]